MTHSNTTVQQSGSRGKFFIPDDHKVINFYAPEGIHRAQLVETKHTQRGEQDEWRLTWELTEEFSARGETYVVAASYRTEKQHKFLLGLLTCWLGSELYDYRSEDGSLDFDLLVGRLAEITVEFYSDGTHREPFRNIAAIHPIGRRKRRPKPVKALHRQEYELEESPA